MLALAASAWTSRAEQQDEQALKLMRGAADLEDSTEKHVSMENRALPGARCWATCCSSWGARAKRYAGRAVEPCDAEPAAGLLWRCQGSRCRGRYRQGAAILHPADRG